MIGMTKSEMFEALKDNHEIEFNYLNRTYIIQPEQDDNIMRLIIGIESDDDYVVASRIFQDKIDDSTIDSLLREACFEGKSFYDIFDDVTVVAMF